MSLCEQYKIAMTSNTTPSPFISSGDTYEYDAYLAFDGNEDTYAYYIRGYACSIMITIAEKIILEKILVRHGFNGISSIIGIDSNNNKTSLSFTTSPLTVNGKTYIEATINNNKSEFMKYQITFSSTYGYGGNIFEIKLYSGFNKSIISNNQICGFDDENNLVNYNDINLLHEKYGLTLQKLNNNIDKLDQYYPFKIIKRKK